MPWFDCAVRRPISANTGGALSPNLGLVLHHAVMNGSGWAFFNSPSAQVSAHFWVLQNGTIEQYVDTNVVAWHGRSLNGRYVGVETEGCTRAPHADPMSEAMVNALARLYAEGARRHGWANALASSDGQRGFGFHRMAVATGCPCDVRLNMRQEILRRAFGGAPIPGQPPTAPPIREDDDLTPDQDSILRQVYNMLVSGSPAHDKPPGVLFQRLVNGAPAGQPTGWGALTTLDSLIRTVYNETKANQARLDRIEAKLK
jgi:hypothetical protein